jgi:hypothetical protein
MCGLVGLYYKNPNKRLSKKAIAELVFINQLRGDDSGGLIYAYHGKDKLYVGSVKEVGTPCDFVTTNDVVNKQIHDNDNVLLAFHNRAATRGIVSEENAHPFKYEHVTLMHNGTLRSEYNINNKYFPVDSQAIAYYLDQENASVQELVGKVNGAYALVWTDLRDGSVNFLRNNDRPLYFAETADFIMWASESRFITFLNAGHGLGITEIKSFPTFTHRKVYLHSGRSIDVKLGEPREVIIPVYKSRYYNYNQYDNDIYTPPANTNTKVVNTSWPQMVSNDTQMATFRSALSKFIFTGGYPYQVMSPGTITTNQELPNKEYMEDISSDVLSHDLALGGHFWNDCLEHGQVHLVSIEDSRIYEDDSPTGMLSVACRRPVDLWDKELTWNLTVSRAVYNMCKRNKLLISVTIDSEQDGMVYTRAKDYAPVFDTMYLYNRKLTIQDFMEFYEVGNVTQQ